MTARKKLPSKPCPNVPDGKKTSLALYVTAKEAYDMWRANPENVKILDCRTTEEFIFVGHPPMAWNIPFAFQTYNWDEEKKHFSMKPNPDFVAQAKKAFNPSDTLLVTCRSGRRASMAIEMLAKAGFKKVYNIIDGIEGDIVCDSDSVFNGLRMKNGWKNSGLPWTYDTVPDMMIILKSKKR